MNVYRDIAREAIDQWQSFLYAVNDDADDEITADELERCRIAVDRMIREKLGKTCPDCGSQPHMVSRYY